jgi:hypothetical protein
MPRPLGEISQALIAAAAQGPGGLRELAHRSQVGYGAARDGVGNLARAGHFLVVGSQSVDYRSRLVQVYALACRWPREMI